MMISPGAALESSKKKTYEELLAERDEILEGIRDFETHRDEPKQEEICPGPEVIYQWDLEYLGDLCKLIAKRYNEEYVCKDEEGEES